jgi:hypothetical protein
MPKIQELQSNGKPRKPDNFQTVTAEQWERLKRKGKLRWRLVPEEKKLKVEQIKIIKK